MKLILDIRVSEEWARRKLGAQVGKPLRQGPEFPVVTKQIIVDSTDPLVEEIKDAVLKSEKRHESFFCFVNQDYVYDQDELSRAQLFRLRPNALLRAFGERHGTIYDETNACAKCGAGRVQCSVLRIEPKYLKNRRSDFLVTISEDEWIVSARLACLLQRQVGSDCTLQPIEDPQGRTIDEWYQLKIRSSFFVAVPPTRFGIDYFHEDASGEYTCPEHSLSGLNLLSELFVHPQHENESYPAVCTTIDRVGRKSGWIVPTPFILLSKSMAQVLMESDLRGFDLQVVHVPVS